MKNTITSGMNTNVHYGINTISPIDLSVGKNKITSSLEVKGKIIHNGLDLDDRLERIEKMLQMPTRDAIMEEKYAELRELSEQYDNLLAQLKTFEMLKS